MSAEFTGRWVRRPGGVMVPVLDEPKPAQKRKPRLSDPVGRLVADIVWTDESLKAAHAAYVRGNRDIVTLAGHREWHRRWKADVRAGRRMSKVDRAWCEKNVVESSWISFARENRTASVANTREETTTCTA